MARVTAVRLFIVAYYIARNLAIRTCIAWIIITSSHLPHLLPQSLRDRQKLQRAIRSFVESIDINCSRVGVILSGRGRRLLLSSSLPRFVVAHYALHGFKRDRKVENGSAKIGEMRTRHDARDYNRGGCTVSRFKCQRYATSITPSAMRASLIYLSLPRVVSVRYLSIS